MYFEDLTHYKAVDLHGFHPLSWLKDLILYKLVGRKLLTIGWLDNNYKFNQKKSSEEFLDKLFYLCCFPVNQTRGYYQCPFCNNEYGFEVERNNKKLVLGSAEIIVKGKKRITYISPDLIYHYIEAHNYFPPYEFIEAVFST